MTDKPQPDYIAEHVEALIVGELMAERSMRCAQRDHARCALGAAGCPCRCHK